jgi:transposase InsO family protein
VDLFSAPLSWATRGHYEVGIAAGVSLRHDHGSHFISHAFQDELKRSSLSVPWMRGRIERI